MTESTRILDALPEHPAPPLPRRYRLVVDGLVRRPLFLSAEAISAMRPAEVTADFACREGWCVPGLHWEGVALQTLLRQADAYPTAGWVQVSAGTFSTCLSREQAATALLALRVGGDPLTHEHGGPVRLVLPGAGCYTSVKWVSHIEIRDTPGDNTARRIALARLDAAQPNPAVLAS